MRRNAGVSIALAVFLLPMSRSAAAPPVSIHDIQYTLNPGGASTYDGQAVDTRGVVTAVYPSGFVIQDGASAPWSGLWVYDPNHRPEPGDSLLLTGTVDEYFGLTELGTITAYGVLARGIALPAPALVTAAMIATGAPSAESFEGVLVRCGPGVVAQAAGSDGSWLLDDGTGQVFVGDNVDYLYIAQLFDPIDHVTGVLLYSWNHFRIQPRFDEDVARPGPGAFALRGTIVTPDVVLPDGYVVVNGRFIQSVSSTAPPVPIVDTGGVIFPGLIDAHDHPAYNVFDELDFGQTFSNRYQWQSDPDYLALRSVYNGMVDQGLLPQMWKYSEARAVTWGAATLQGSFPDTDWDAYAHSRVLARNPERFPGRIYSSVFPMNLSASTRTRIKNLVAGDVVRSVVIHLSEGVDASSLAEFDTWVGWGMLDSTNVIIHGIPYGPAQFNQMAQAGAKLVVSPRSELALYAATPDVPAALAAGVSVSLGVDWCVSGSKGMLEEIAVTDSLNQHAWGGVISDQALVEMVTVNPAEAFGRAEDMGRIAPGYLADFTVVSPGAATPYRALIDATPAGVRLVMVEGRAVYGTASLMDQLAGPDADLEPYYVCDGVQRRIDFHLGDDGVPFSSQTLAETEDQLLAAYANLLLLTPCQSTGVTDAPVARRSLALHAHPVPFSERTEILVERTDRSDDAVRVSVYDVAGRRVRTLLQGRIPSQGARLFWDGRDERGERVASGVYYVQAVRDRERVVRRLVLVR